MDLKLVINYLQSLFTMFFDVFIANATILKLLLSDMI